jgi:hypothetical protein
MNWIVPKIWDGGEVWILGGGPSLIEQFNIPKEVVQQVLDKKMSPNAYSPYLSAIHKKHTIGVNVSYLMGDWIDIVFFGDNGFFLGNQENLASFPGLKVTCHPNAGKQSWAKYLARDNKYTKGISTNPQMVSWNGNSGGASINLAYHMGAKRIILVGFDMKLGEANMQHWHNAYNRLEMLQTNPNFKALPFNRHLLGFTEIAKDAKKLGIEIINASPNSAINVFEKVSVSDLLSLKKEV